MTFSNKRNLWWNKNIQLADLAEESKFMISPFRSYIMVNLKTTISTNSALSLKLLRFHVVYAQTMETFFYQGS